MTTIRNSTEVSRDVFNDPKWPLFSNSKILSDQYNTPKISVISYTRHQPGLPRHMDTLFDEAASYCAPVFLQNNNLIDYKSWLFVSQHSWKASTRVVLYKKLWKSLAELPFENADEGQELLFNSEAGTCFAGMVQVTPANFRSAMQALRKYLCVIILSHQETMGGSESIREIFNAAFVMKKRAPELSINLKRTNVISQTLNYAIGSIPNQEPLKYAPRANGPSGMPFVGSDGFNMDGSFVYDAGWGNSDPLAVQLIYGGRNYGTTWTDDSHLTEVAGSFPFDHRFVKSALQNPYFWDTGIRLRTSLSTIVY